MKPSMIPPESPFSSVEIERVIFEDEDVVAFYDGYPISPGHALVVAKQVTPSLFDLPPLMRQHIWEAVSKVRSILQKRHSPDGFNVGLNDGPAAGQTINHAHIHVIPRYKGDQPDPRGGVRWIFPDKARYWNT